MGDAKDGSGIQKFILKTNKQNRYGTGMHGKQVSKTRKGGKQKAVPLPPLRKYKMHKGDWFSPNSKVFNHKSIQTPLPTPISVNTGDRVEKSKTQKKLDKIKGDCQPTMGKTLMKCI